jgi:hypothetical protein
MSFSIDHAQTDDMQLLSQYPDKTIRDTLEDLSFLAYRVPPEDVLEILGVVAIGIEEV